MPSKNDLIQAKQVLSSRLLRRGLQANVLTMNYAVKVSEAVTKAGRNVHAVGVGRKISDGQATETMAVRLYVAQKLAPSLLPPRDRLPESIDGIPTDVIESPPAFITAPKPKKRKVAAASATCTNDRRKRQRPVVAGISAAHRDVTAGTIACFCRSTRLGDDPGQMFVLSNNHVFANVNQGTVDDDLYQPGPADGGTIADHFAELHRFVDINLNGTTPNRVDAAIGRVLTGVDIKAEICRVGTLVGTDQAVVDMQVCKHGRTTGFTEGIVTDESLDVLVGMDHSDPEVAALFESQMRIERLPAYPAIGLGGDSGSLVVDTVNGNAVGLYFAGPDSGTYGLANHIADVLTELQIELV